MTEPEGVIFKAGNDGCERVGYESTDRRNDRRYEAA